MALPSQTARPQSARRMRYTPRRRRSSPARRVLGLLIAGGLLVALVVIGPRLGGGDGGGGGGGEGAGVGANPAETPLNTINGAPHREPPLPMVGPDPGGADGAAEPARAAPAPADPPAGAERADAPRTLAEPESAPKAPPTPRRNAYLVRLIQQADAAIERGRLVDARDLLNRVLHHDDLPSAEQDELRLRLTTINDRLLFSDIAAPDDPLTRQYTIRPGDSLSGLAQREQLKVDWLFIQRVNGITDPSRIRAGQPIKLVQGPFHARISKRDYRLDVYADRTDADGHRLYVRSFPVGLGEFDMTPAGAWVVKKGKLINPRWTNPRTGETFEPNDPKNPIGERWIGLRGVDANTELEEGYGIHGTIEPDSIGRQMSMGCVRCLPGHIELIYELLVPEASEVVIVE